MAQFEWEFIQLAKEGKPERTYRFVVEFGLHCFTRGPNTHLGEKLHHMDNALLYADSRETRIFSSKRYNLSFKLPEIAKSFSKRPCFRTGKGNFFAIEPVNVGGGKREYEIYFTVTKEKRGLLKLFVQSAYVRDKAHLSSQPRQNKIGFFTIAHKKIQGRIGD